MPAEPVLKTLHQLLLGYPEHKAQLELIKKLINNAVPPDDPQFRFEMHQPPVN